jgi:hypothetical protein
VAIWAVWRKKRKKRREKRKVGRGGEKEKEGIWAAAGLKKRGGKRDKERRLRVVFRLLNF